MDAITTLFPVFIMLALGLLSRIKSFITYEQKEGVNAIVFNILFPIMVFNLLFTSHISTSAIGIVAYVFVAFIFAMIVGHFLSFLTGRKIAHISPYLLTSVEGGNVALPLYTSIVGMSYATNTVIFDLAASMIVFVTIPILIARQSSGDTNIKNLIKEMLSNSFLIAVILGVSLNLLGFHNMLSSTQFYNVYTNTMSMITGPIVGMILFIIGYNLKLDLETLPSLIKLVLLRVVIYVIVITGFFILFPDLMADKIYMIAVIIYFLSPTGFAVPMLIQPITNEKDQDFMAAFISLFMVVTLIVYTGVVLFIM